VFDAPASDAPGSNPSSKNDLAGGVGGDAAGSQRLAIAAVAGAVAVGALAIVLAMSGAGGSVVDGPLPSAAEASDIAEGNSGEIVVDVSGAVGAPGLYRLRTGARVGDAIDAAGGFSPRVDVERVGRELNLATTLADGAQIHVPSRDDPAAGGVPGPSPRAGGAGGQLVNLNTATEAELDALSGIGPVTAGKIIESRGEAPFKTVDDLRERGLVGEKTFEKIRAQLTVG
jgi:competence protein ComEA